MSLRRIANYLVVFCVIAVLTAFSLAAASEHHGTVTFGGLPVPGATVTATQGNKHLTAITDQQGAYTFTDLDDGMWKFQVEMLGFATQSQDITIGPDTPGTMWELKLLSLEEIAPGASAASAESAQPATSPATGGGNAPAAAAPPAAKDGGFQRAAVNSTSNAPSPPPPPAADTGTAASDSSSDLTARAATGLLVNGSVNNGAASAFAQVAAFGNNRTGPGSLYNGGVGVIFDTSAWDAAPFSVTGLVTPKPGYNDAQVVSALGGPLGIPHHLISNSNFFVAYQHQANDNATTQFGRVPTMLERGGNLSQTLNATGQPVQVFNPATNMPFSGNIVPVSMPAQELLNEYPMPNVTGSGPFNYQAPVLNSNQQDSVQARAMKNAGLNQLFGTFAYVQGTTETTNLFGFQDMSTVSGVDTAINWSHRFNRGFTFGQFFSTHFKYEYSRLATDVTPYFANRSNISGAAGILGNNQDPVNWGPPNLIFSSGVAPLSDSEYARDANQTQALSYDSLWTRGRHSIQFGGDIRQLQFNVHSQQDPRGTFAFTGAATQEMAGGAPVAGTGSDLADFLLGIPDTAAIDFGNADKYLRGWTFDAFINDDWRVKPGLTLDVGVRWEYADPFAELRNRLANLDIAPGFTAAAPVVAGDPTGAVTGQSYPSSLLRSDFQGVEPRVALAWRPKSTSPLVVRAGYGIYDDTSVYQFLALQLAQQPPFTKTLSIENSAADPLTLATGFNTVPSATPNTFAIDPNFRVGYAQNWMASVQEDLPGSLTMTATYLGTKGTRLVQESLPNTYPLGATNPCPACPAGFVYLSSNGNSTHEAGQIQLRRRLRDGLTATVQYTYSKSIDDASAFGAAGLTTASTAAVAPATGGGATGGGAGSGGASSAATGSVGAASASGPSIAQNWLNLSAERGLSSFDQRHLMNFDLQYTTGEGIHGGALLTGWKGLVFKEWTVTTDVTVGSGLPLTPVYLTNVAGTGVTGTIRPNYTGASVEAAPAGYFLNPAAYAAPAPGQWGNAGRDSITGPGQFTLNASMSRTFRLNARLNGTWRVDAFNLLNTVTYTAWNTTVTSPLFGQPTQANTMRKLQTTFRVRF